jgi:hypothetical protein
LVGVYYIAKEVQLNKIKLYQVSAPIYLVC